MSTIGRSTTSTVVPSSSSTAEAMTAPAMAVAPAGPWAHAQEDAVVEITWSVKAIRRACVWGIVVVAVSAAGWDTDVNNDLSVGCWHQGQRRKQRCSTK
jgi:hypothetical protein